MPNLKRVACTGGGSFITDASDDTIRGWMFQFIREWRKKNPRCGIPHFTWGPVRFVHHGMKGVGVSLVHKRSV